MRALILECANLKVQVAQLAVDLQRLKMMR
jgi:hypothetical protein